MSFATLFQAPKKEMFTPRPYQVEAIDIAVDYFHGKANYNAFEILPTGSGKSIIVANVAKQLNEQTVVFQPSKEILEQNLAKFQSYGYSAGVYSASAGGKHLDKVTFATIGSVMTKMHLFRNVKNIIIDECHLVNSKDEGSMYNTFIANNPQAKVLGLTATPYRLTTSFDGAMLKFLNRTNPRIFNKVLYHIQNKVLFDSGHLSKLEYYSINLIDRKQLQINSSGTDFTDASLKSYYRKENMAAKTTEVANRLLLKRKNLLVFCSLLEEAYQVAKGIPGAVVITGDIKRTPVAERSRILAQFKAGVIRCVINVGVLTTGFDYPELECILLARSTMSLALYYQIFGRGFRPFEFPDGTKKTCWLVDLGGNINKFGKFETMEIRQIKGLYSIWNGNKQLTNITFNR